MPPPPYVLNFHPPPLLSLVVIFSYGPPFPPLIFQPRLQVIIAQALILGWSSLEI